MADRNPRPWTQPDSWFGVRWDGWLVFLGKHRDSDDLDQSNFAVALAELTECYTDSDWLDHADSSMGSVPPVYVVSESHWAVGWIEWIAIHPSCPKAVTVARLLAERLDQYPVLDDDDYSEREEESAQQCWSASSLSDRLYYIRDTGLSLYSIRGTSYPSDDCGTVRDRLLGH